MGKGCARQIPAAVPAGCTCQAAQANPGAPGKVTFTGFLGFSGIHTPGRSLGWGVGGGAKCGGPGCDGDKLGILRAVWKHEKHYFHGNLSSVSAVTSETKAEGVKLGSAAGRHPHLPPRLHSTFLLEN